jgi:PncC family amidohydrolase
MTEQELAEQAASTLRKQHLTIATMESCTGGRLANVLTNVPHCGDFFVGGIVAYATETKEKFGVDKAIIEKFGVVSHETAEAMAQAVQALVGADVGVGITGVAGPAPQDGIHVGRVYIGISIAGSASSRSFDFPPESIEAITGCSVREALTWLVARLEAEPVTAPSTSSEREST